jgi:hypothetical protein
MKYQNDYGNIIHGISRQPAERMYKGQVIGLVNGRNSLMRGTEKRAGFRYVGDLIHNPRTANALVDAQWAIQQRGDGLNFLTAYGKDDINIFDLDATRKNFQFSNVRAHLYYSAGRDEPNGKYGVLSVLDTTYVTNRDVIPLGDNDTDEVDMGDSILYVEFKTFEPGAVIEVSGGSAIPWEYSVSVFDGYVTVTNGVPGAEKVNTEQYTGSFHSQALFDLVDDLGGYVSVWNNWVRLSGDSAKNFTISEGGSSIIDYTNTDISAIEKLPANALEGDVCMVQEGVGEDKNEGYFVATRTGSTSTGFGPVTWKETIGPSSVGTFDRNTMPHVIVRDGENFTFQQYTWADREVGDSDTNPYPSFVTYGETIQSLGLFQNRLYLTAGETIYSSATDTFDDFWRESAFYFTAADPYEVYADTNELNTITFSDLFDGDLVFFSANGQFVMEGDHVHTYEDSYIQVASQYKADMLANPVLAGDKVFFATNYGSFAGVREFYTDSYTATKRAKPVTDHVRDLMEGRIRHMATSTNIDVLMCLNDLDRTKANVYEWRTSESGTEKSQSAWGEWFLPAEFEFEYIAFINSLLYAVVSHPDVGFQLWELDWDDANTLHGLDFPVRLDGRFTLQGTYYPEAGQTIWDANDAGYHVDELVFMKGADSDSPGFMIDATHQGNGVWTYDSDISDITIIAGIPYDHTIELPVPFIRDSQGEVQGIERVQLQSLFFHFTSIGECEVDVIDGRGRSRTTYFNNRRMNHDDNRTSYINTGPDTLKVPVRKKTDELRLIYHSNNAYPSILRGIEWFAEYNQQGRR